MTLTQKLAQLDEQGYLLLMEIVLLWFWLEPKLQNEFPGDVFDRHNLCASFLFVLFLPPCGLARPDDSSNLPRPGLKV